MYDNDGNELKCPACGWRGLLEDFDQVVLLGTTHVHCPSCDANLGSREHVSQRAA
ncbi:MAG: hypothetical protein KDI71_09130 [Xanthomonadales bacterium]|nr:hypothetical protein [Xanthomonadales bacterium]